MNKLIIVIIPVAAAVLLLSSCSTTLSPDVRDMLVDEVDVQRYSGLWYQVGRYPHSFQSDNCAESTAEYTIREDGKISVENNCWEDAYGGISTSSVTAVATPVDSSANWLNVVFFLVFPADYLIIELDYENYEWAAVTTPSLNSLWILSREPALPSEVYEPLVDSLVQKGFERDKIIKTSRQQ